jgi:hypothetical protein
MPTRDLFNALCAGNKGELTKNCIVARTEREKKETDIIISPMAYHCMRIGYD